MMKDPNQVIIRPLVTEASLEAVDNENKLILLVDRKANKDLIRWAVETLYDVVVVKINTQITPDGRKKAFVRLAPEYSAAEVATKLGIF
jgi:ribosomal protein uL23